MERAGAGPRDPMARAAACFQAGRHDEAEALCRAILQRDPRHFYAWHLLATLAALRQDWERAADLASRALAIDSGNAEVLANRGAAYRMLGRYEEALQDYDRALAVAPRNPHALNNRGVALAALNLHHEAIAAYDAALAIAPDYARARFNRGLSRLVLGDFARGWPDHEYRGAGSDTAGPPRAFDVPPWTGREPLEGRTILLHAEQGMGDSIQFARYAEKVRALGARVLLEVHAPLKALFHDFPWADAVFALGEALPSFDLHCPLMSLPARFDTRLETIPAPIPYLHADGASMERWGALLRDVPRPRIGIAWSGSTTLRNDRHRSIPLATLAPLREAGAAVVCLQKEIRGRDRPELARGSPIAHFEDRIADFRDTAALIEHMDLVISVDTAVAHLAGAMGKPLWLLLPFSPDWRWLLGRDDSPWYPGARLFRQPRLGDWPSAVARVAEGAARLARPSGAPVVPRVE